MKRILLIDASNLLHRGYHAIVSRFTNNVSGEEKEAAVAEIPPSVFVISFLQSLKNYVVKFEADEVYAVWDKKLLFPSTNFRKESKTVAYKANRDPNISKLVFASESILTPILQTLGVKVIFPRVMEADDVIAWLSHKLADNKITIVSVDRDLAQLVTTNCDFYNPIKDITITPDTFEAYLDVPQNVYLRYKAIVGDVSDNIDGLDGFGKVKGKKLALNWDKAELSQEQRDTVESNIKLIDLAYGYTVHPEEVPAYEEQYEKLSYAKSDFKEFANLLEEHKLTPIKAQLEKWRGIFNRNGKIGSVPVNNYLKNLFT